ncbi:hypothetical protein J0X57_004134 [Salmonella enterica]|nr:hypothetical protein [Salmonella enterica]
MRLYIYIPLLILSVYVFFINGFLALIGGGVSLIIFVRDVNLRTSVLFIPVMVLSAALTLLPLFYKIKYFNINGSVEVYVTALEQSVQANMNDCGQLQAKDYGRFVKIREDLMNSCGSQPLNDVSYLSTSFIGAMYSVLYNEFSLASVLIEIPARENKCLGLIDEFLKICPEQKIHFSQKNLQMLRDFERKQ